MHLQLDLLGGLAGDMFIAAVLDAFPEHSAGLIAAIAALQGPFSRPQASARVESFNDGVFRGLRFVVEECGSPEGGAPPSAPAASTPVQSDVNSGLRHQRHPERHPHSHTAESKASEQAQFEGASLRNAEPPADAHGHVPWASIRTRLQAVLAPGVARHALGIFGVLAQAEAEVHGVAVEAVEFHEVGAWDSVADIVGAAWLIDTLDARSWQVGPVPLGAGRIQTAHGVMPVPPPATALLLRGFQTLDDGIGGERVTPTGAAILKYLMPDGATVARLRRGAEARVLRRSGTGFGTRRLSGISNCVRLLVFDDAEVDSAGSAGAARTAPAHRELAVVEFEVDDQTAEELAIGLERLRAHPAIFDVVQAPVFGKKGRMMTSVRLLARPADLEAVLDACFCETTTIGLRHKIVSGRALPRRSDEVVVEGHRVRVKSVERPGGTTAKAESADALSHETQRARRALRQEAERQVLDAAAQGAERMMAPSAASSAATSAAPSADPSEERSSNRDMRHGPGSHG